MPRLPREGHGEDGVAALTQLYDEMQAYAPPGILGWDNPDASNAFLNGEVAVLEGWASFILPMLDDPDASQVVGNWNVAPYPENGTGNFTQHNFAIFNTSQNQQAAQIHFERRMVEPGRSPQICFNRLVVERLSLQFHGL